MSRKKVIVILFAYLLTGCISAERTNSKPSQETKKVETKVTKANFEKLKEGMTLEQVISLLGPIAETKYETKDRTGSAGIYNWGSVSNGYIMGEFHNGKLTSKTQISLKE